jgi:hypothetical protein
MASTFAAEVNIASTSDTLIQYTDKALEKGTVSVDKLLTAMQTIHEQQKSELASALEKGNAPAAQRVLDQRNQMYPVTIHLYSLKAGSGTTFTNASGTTYTLRQQAPLPRINLSRGDDNYYSFPTQETFLELQRNIGQTGALHNELSITSGNQTYLPTYFYAGNNTLQELSRREEGTKITELKDANTDMYYFYDVPSDFLTTKDFSFTLTSGGNISGQNIYTAISYSPEYYLTSLDKGLQFCQEVAKFVGTTSNDKEYLAKECGDAANGIFYKGMHKDILAYATSLYL